MSLNCSRGEGSGNRCKGNTSSVTGIKLRLGSYPGQQGAKLGEFPAHGADFMDKAPCVVGELQNFRNSARFRQLVRHVEHGLQAERFKHDLRGRRAIHQGCR
jgi:hypothetical protein